MLKSARPCRPFCIRPSHASVPARRPDSIGVALIRRLSRQRIYIMPQLDALDLTFTSLAPSVAHPNSSLRAVHSFRKCRLAPDFPALFLVATII